MDGNFAILISKINAFTRKFYLNKLLRGLIYTLTALLAIYLFSFVLVYYFQPAPLLKTILFFSGITTVCLLFIVTVIKPAMAYFRLSSTMSLEEAAGLIGSHFAPVSDKLLNTLQLKALADLSPEHNQLLSAGIDQKITELKVISFSTAIRLSENKKYIKYFLVPLLLIIMVGLIAPAILKEGTQSYVQYNKEIIPPAPFDFVVLNSTLNTIQGEDFKLQLQLKGDKLPQDIYIMEGLNTYKVDKASITRFNYLFKNLQHSIRFHFSGGGFQSKTYQIAVKPRPSVLNITAKVVYPSYLKKANETIENAGDLTVPEGSTIEWSVFTAHTSQLVFRLGNTIHHFSLNHNRTSFRSKITKSQTYLVSPQTALPVDPDTVGHRIEMIRDESPTIIITEKADSLSSKARYFSGEIGDDHGFSSLHFVYQIKGQVTRKLAISIPIKKASLHSSFFFFWNLKELPVKPGETVEYYLEVADNDGVNGPKFTRSPVKTLQSPSVAQLNSQLSTESNALKNKMAAAIKLASQAEKESKKLRENFLDKKSLSFEDKKEINLLLDKQKKLQEAVEKIQSSKEKQTLNQTENDVLKEELIDKQKKIDDLFNQVSDPKTKELLQKLQSLTNQNDKNQVQETLSRMSLDNKSLKNELDRILELYKQLEFEQNLKNQINVLKNLAAAQQKISNQSASKKIPLADLSKQQEIQNAAFRTLADELKKLAAKNQDLDRPNSFSLPEKELQSLQQQQQQSLDELSKNQLKKAAETQEKTAKEMQQMAENMEHEGAESAETESNLNSAELRKLLQNLLVTSFEQEKLMLSLRKMSVNDPQYNSQVKEQKQIRDNMNTIADTLRSLSKRIPQIESTVTEEMKQINFNIEQSLEYLADKRKSEAGKNQQYTMSSINNLALMLNEVMSQLEKNKKNQKAGGKGKSKGSMQQLQQMQQQLNQKMEKARQELQQQGKQGSVPKGTMTEEFAKMAQQQQMIREALQKINQEENKDGKNSKGDLNQLIRDMKTTEYDLVSKKIEMETLQRQQRVMTKMLEAEKAMKEQGEEQQRESKAGKALPPSFQKEFLQFKKQQQSEQEMTEKLSPAMNYYYKNKITEYFKLLNLRP
jgi:hypothetical protein